MNQGWPALDPTSPEQWGENDLRSEQAKNTRIERFLRGRCAAIVFLTALLLTPLTVLPSQAQELPDKPKPRLRDEKAWLGLSTGALTMAVLDMRFTQHQKDVLGDRFVEHNPFSRPFVNLPKPAYYAAGSAGIYGVNYLGWRMKHSQRWCRHIWWVPQLAAMGANTYGYVRTKSAQIR